MVPKQPKRIKIAILYNSRDQSSFDALSDHLAILRRKEPIDLWHETEAGASLREQVQTSLNESRIIFLLISSSFNRDDSYYSSLEMIDFIGKCAKEGKQIWPIIIKPVSGFFFEDYEVFFGQREEPVTQWKPQDEGYKEVTKKIGGAITSILSYEWSCYGDICYHQAYLPEALSAYRKSLAYVPRYSPALLGELSVLLKQGKLEEAEHCFNAIVSYDTGIKITVSSKIKQETFTYACTKGHALLMLGRPLEAQKVFQEVYQQIALSTDDAERKICAEAYCGEGDACLKLGEHSPSSINYYNQALTAYTKAGEFSLNDYRHLLGIGETYIAFGDHLQSDSYYEKALKTYLQVIAACPNNVLALTGQGSALYRLHRFNEALTAYEKALQIDQYEVQVYGGAGYVLLKLSRTQEALLVFEKALYLENNACYIYGKGQAQAKLRHYEEALSAYHEAYKQGYESEEFFVSCAEALLELADVERINGKQVEAQKHYDEARTSYEHAVERGWRNFYIYYYGLGRVFFGKKEWANALEWYKKALPFITNEAKVYLEIGKTLVELGDYQQALDHFNLAHSLCHNAASKIDEADIHTAYGNAYYLMAGKSNSEHYNVYQKKACLCYEKAVAIRKNVEALVGLGKARMALNRYEKAIDAFDQAIEFNPLLIECSFLKGKCYYMLRQYSDACNQYYLTIKSGLDTISVYKDLGDALLSMSSYVDAIEAFDKAIEHMGKDAKFAYCGRGSALYAQGKNKEALQSFDNANRLDPSICLQPQYRRILEDIKYSIEGRLRTNPQDVSVYRQKGDVLRFLGERSEDIIDAYTFAVENGDVSANIYYYRGEAYYAVQDYRNALDDFKEALKFNPSLQEAQQMIYEVEHIVEPSQKGFFKRLIFWK